MSKVCDICGKGPLYGNHVSHAHNKSKRRWNPNLHKMRINDNGRIRRVKVCTQCLKKVNLQKVV